MPAKAAINTSITVIALALGASLLWYFQSSQTGSIDSFDDCAAAGYPIMESYPAQCRTPDGRTFMQNIGTELEKSDLIRVDTPRPNTSVTNPLIITGAARGTWFFEASFPIHLQDAGGTTVATTVAQAQAEWMTTEFVPFRAELDIPDTVSGAATLVLEKDNPSGLPAQADELRIPITVIAHSPASVSAIRQ